MHREPLPPHLPKPPSDPVVYQQLHDLSWWLRSRNKTASVSEIPTHVSMSVSEIPTHVKPSVATEDREATTLDDADFCVFDTTGDSDAWREIRIPTGLSAAEVYRKLPSATDVEYGGYLTKTRIRYVRIGNEITVAFSSPSPYPLPPWERGHRTVISLPILSGDSAGVYATFEKSCTFHSHLSGDPAADAPSSLDIYGFLKWEHQRTITVGSDWIWVWTKNQQTLKMARRLWKWELENLAPTLLASCRSHGKHMVSLYAGQALQELGLRWPCRQLLDPKRWMPLLRETLGIRTRLIRR